MSPQNSSLRPRARAAWRLTLTGALATQLLACGAGLDAEGPLSGADTLESQGAGLTGPDRVGGVLLPATSYPVPAGAVFISPDGSDTAGTGTQAQPFKTLTKAVANAQAGETIVVRGGIYRLTAPVSVMKQLTVQPYPGEKAWFKGSAVLSGWTQSGDDWVTDLAPLPRAEDATLGFGCSDNHAKGDRCFLDVPVPPPGQQAEDHPANHLEQVFVNDVALRQVLTRAEVVPATSTSPATFYVDRSNGRVFIGVSPVGKTVEATVARMGLVMGSWTDSSGTGLVVRGLGFAHFAETSLLVLAPQARVDSCVAAWNSVRGIYVNAKALDSVVSRSSIAFNGALGLHGAANGLRVENGLVKGNNTEGFAKTWGAAGMKFIQAQGLKLRGNLVEDNNATALWMDVDINAAEVVRNRVRDNAGIGIFFEISKGAIIASNVVTGNSAGIMVANSHDARLWNNTVVNNDKALYIKEDPRNTSDASGGYRATVGTEIRNNVLSDPQSDYLVDTGSYQCPDAVETVDGVTYPVMIQSINYNVYHRSSTTNTLYTHGWVEEATRTSTGCSEPRYRKLSDFKAATGREPNGMALDNVSLDALFVSPLAGDWRLESTSPARGKGQALPQAVADAVKGGLSQAEADAINTGAGAHPGALHLY
jgi:parallel beta-helix repeat protein